MDEFVLDERKCIVISRGKPSVTFLIPQMSYEFEESITALASCFSGDSFRIAAFEIKNWDCELTPWKMETTDRSFGDGADSTIEFTEKFIKTIEEKYGETRFAIAGYSLAGVFSLYSGTIIEEIRGVVSASGSLWYKGIKEYVTDSMPSDKLVYLSLGDMEEHTKNEIMKTVGDNTRETFTVFCNKGIRCTLEMNPGGHFKEPAKRMYLGMKWISDNLT